MSDTNKGKFKNLITHTDMDNVQQGLVLAEAMVSSKEELFELFDIPVNVSKTDDIIEAFQDLEHRGHIIQWIYTYLEQQGVQWVIERERLYLIDVDQYNARPFTYYVNTITKEQYVFWKEHGGENMNRSLFQYLLAVYEVFPETIEEAREIVESEDFCETYKEIPKDIPDEAFILPIGDNIYELNNTRSGWVMFIEELSKIVVDVKERVGDQDLNVWSGTLDDLCNLNPDNYIPTNVKHTRIRPDEYFMDFFQSEKALLCASIKKRGAFNIQALQIHEVVDSNIGAVLDHTSIYYDGEQADTDWACFSAEPYGPSLYNGLDLYTAETP
jgi:hypothetical protein